MNKFEFYANRPDLVTSAFIAFLKNDCKSSKCRIVFRVLLESSNGELFENLCKQAPVLTY